MCIRDRYLEFFAFDLISDSIEEHSKAAQLQFLAENGFDVVPYVYMDTHDVDELRELIADFKPAEYGYPVDGVVMECTGTAPRGYHPDGWLRREIL